MSNLSQPALALDLTGAIGSSVTLEILGIIPNKKNSKMLVTKDPRGRPLQRPLLLTKPEHQQALERITESLRLMLLSGCLTASGATLTASCLRSWIASSLPADDAWTHIPKLSIRAELCAPGQEGARVVITRIG